MRGGLLEELREKAYALRMDQSDAIEWGIRKWLEEHGKAAPPKGRPVYTTRGYELFSELVRIYNDPQTIADEGLVELLDALLKTLHKKTR